MHPLDRKLVRDLKRLAAQATAIALVMAAGIATLILAVGAHASLEDTRTAFYERYRFAHVFATATRAPKGLMAQILAIPGVAGAEPRIEKSALLDIEGMAEPGSASVISLPDHRALTVNRLVLRAGRMPEFGRPDEVVISEPFAEAHGFTPGARFGAILEGRKRTLTAVGIAMSPEFIYAIGPGDVVPDDRRFGILWMSEEALAGLSDLDGAFNSVVLRLLPSASAAAAVEALDAVLERYGGTGAIERRDQFSHAFVDSELEQLEAMARVLPPVFLLVTAFLINMTLSRLIALEREQIGLLKAVGYGPAAIGAHYLKLVLAITALGVAVGAAAGTWFGQGLTRLYADNFHFPLLIFSRDPSLYLIAIAASLAAGVLGAVRAVWSVMRLPPAVAMRPPAPTRYRRSLIERLGLMRPFSQLALMAVRYLTRWPVRAGLTMLGVAFSIALLIASLFSLDSIDVMIDVTFFQTDRQDATLTFADVQSPRAVQNAEDLPGVLRAEAFRSVPVELTLGPRSRKLAIDGKPRDMALSRVLDRDLGAIAMPESGLVLSAAVAEILDAQRGDLVDVRVLDGKRRETRVPVTEIVQSYFGLGVYMDLDALNALIDEAPAVSGVHIAYDSARTGALYEEVKNTPVIAGIALNKISVERFRALIAETIDVMVAVYVGLALIVAGGVVYNSARIQLSERARELASLRVLGFTRAEVSRVLLIELAIVVLIANPFGWLIGYALAYGIVQGFASDVYRVPLIIDLKTYAVSSLIVVGAAVAAALIVRRRVDRLDLIAVLKTRD